MDNISSTSGSIDTWTGGAYNTPKTTTRTTKTTTKEYDNKGKVVKEVTVEETVTETIDHRSPYWVTNSTLPVKLG
jgi:hypothetical protein